MYDSRPRPAEGEPIEEVLPAAINATATSERQSKATELARRHSTDEPAMRVMRPGSPVRTNVLTTLAGLPPVFVVGAAIVVLALVVLAVVLI